MMPPARFPSGAGTVGRSEEQESRPGALLNNQHVLQKVGSAAVDEGAQKLVSPLKPERPARVFRSLTPESSFPLISQVGKPSIFLLWQRAR